MILQKKDMPAYMTVEGNYLVTLSKPFIFPARQNQFYQENIFNNVPVRRTATTVSKNSAFVGSFPESLFWYQAFNIKRKGRLRGS